MAWQHAWWRLASAGRTAVRPLRCAALIAVPTGIASWAAVNAADVRLAHSEAAPLVPPLPSVNADADSETRWNRTIAAAVPAVVSIKVNRVRAFDTSNAGTVQATGFVVDAERGFILTNRHVAGPGPVVAEAIFQDNSEVALTVAYYDPVHDFAFFKFDPAAVKHMTLVQLPLAPHEAETASEIVIIGNNAGEKCSIHRTTLARLDRNAPAYSRSGYNDFNTFYFHSASGTTGGSSGAPVLNQKGHAIALNAGGKVGTSAGFFLPLHRVERALKLLQAAQPVPRGTAQMVCLHQTFDEARRLGVPERIEDEVRASFRQRGMLVIAELLPDGPAAQVGLQPGDVVVQVGGELCNSFVQLEEKLDASVGSSVELLVCRGGELLSKRLLVNDLHTLTPHRYVEVGGAVLNELSYQQARNYGMPVRGVYVAHPGYMLRQARINKGSILCSVNGVPTPTLEAFVGALDPAEHGERMVVRYFDLGARAYTHLTSIRMDRKWFPMSDCSRRSDGDGSWEVEPVHVDTHAAERHAVVLPVPAAVDDAEGQISPAAAVVAASVRGSVGTAASETSPEMGDGPPTASTVPSEPPAPMPTAARGEAAPATDSEKAAASVVSSLVTVDFSRPFNIDGETGLRYRGTGLVLDAERGIVAVDRNTVTSTLGDVTVTLGGQVSVPATVEYVHPLHNFALVKYDTKAVPAELHVASAALSHKLPTTGSPLTLVGLKSGLNDDFDDSRPVDTVSRRTAVASFGWMKLPLPNPPRYQISNVEMIGLEVSPPLDGGVLVDEHGVCALWVSCAYQAAPNQSAQVFRGLPINLVRQASEPLRQGQPPPKWNTLGATLEPLSLATAQQLGLPEEGRAAHAASKPTVGVPSVLLVTHVHSLSPAHGKLHGGDLLCTIDGQRVCSLYDAECAMQGRRSVSLEVVRDGKPMVFECDTQQCDGLGTQHVVGWAGLLLQSTPDAVAAQRAVSARGAYASYRFFGSPASRYDLSPTSHIIEVDAQPTPDLQSFLEHTRHKRDGEVVRIKHIDLEGRVRMSTLKLDLKYWPTYLLERGPDGSWARRSSP